MMTAQSMKEEGSTGLQDTIQEKLEKADNNK